MAFHSNDDIHEAAAKSGFKAAEQIAHRIRNERSCVNRLFLFKSLVEKIAAIRNHVRSGGGYRGMYEDRLERLDSIANGETSGIVRQCFRQQPPQREQPQRSVLVTPQAHKRAPQYSERTKRRRIVDISDLNGIKTDWVKRHKRDPRVVKWLKRNPPPPKWKGSRTEWAYLEMPWAPWNR